MNTINKYQSLFIMAAVILGLLLGQISSIGENSGSLILPFLMLMLFGLFLNIPIKSLTNSFLNIKFFSISTVINFIWTPILAYLLASIFFNNNLSIAIGLLMLLVTPCTDWYLIFTGIAKGNLALAASILPLNLILQVILLPVYLLLFFGETESIDLYLIWESVFFVLLIPFALAQGIRFLLFWKKNTEKIGTQVLSFFEKFQLLFLSLAIIAMFASQGAYLIENINVALLLIAPLSIFFFVNFFIAKIAARLLKFDYADRVSLSFTILARNSPISLAIAVSAFPFEPLIALSLVIAPLIELPVLGLISQILLKARKQERNSDEFKIRS